VRVKLCTELLCVAVLICRVAFPDSGPSARDLFASGLEFVRNGDFEAAAAQFERAYRVSPNYAVLYNLGQAYVALGKPVEAVQALEKFLEVGGAAIDPTRRSEVQDLISFNEKRIGFASLIVEPPNAEISIDGRPAAKGAAREHVALSTGTHSVTATADGYTPFIGTLEITREKTTTLTVALRAVEKVAPSAVGLLAIECAVPAARVALDGGAPLPQTTEALPVTGGTHVVTCERKGYLPFRTQLEINQPRVTRIVCDLRIDPHLLPSDTGIVSLTIPGPRADVWIDGRRSALTARLPEGPHRVYVQRTGFESWTHLVVVRPGFPETIAVNLRPTPEHALELQQAAKLRRTWAYVIGGTGLALLGSSAALYVSNNQRYTSWQQQRDALARDIQNQRWSPTLSDRAQNLQTQAASIQSRDDLAVGGAILGGALLSYSIASWLSARP